MTQQFHPWAHSPGLTLDHLCGWSAQVCLWWRDLGGTECPSWGEWMGRVWPRCTRECYAAARSRLDAYVATCKGPLVEKVEKRMRTRVSLSTLKMHAGQTTVCIL